MTSAALRWTPAGGPFLSVPKSSARKPQPPRQPPSSPPRGSQPTIEFSATVGSYGDVLVCPPASAPSRGALWARLGGSGKKGITPVLVRYLILSDLHSNWEALDAVARESSGDYDKAICCGDLIGYAADPNAVVRSEE